MNMYIHFFDIASPQFISFSVNVKIGVLIVAFNVDEEALLVVGSHTYK